ncbi:redox-sensing transcriptional repressor Rex [Catenulispora rubra]|uniref:redox-sensing transcriptional repressor Rex n=1 Tax=Catenulispora rubra TaxID=280293 RepID=UPI001891FCE0|nr:redox-sensing transcriptional repressor Rex [Catenulispora rubra]
MASTSNNASGGTGSDSRSGNGSSLRSHRQGIPEATVARLPVYLRALISMQERGIITVSSEELAVSAGVNSAKLRKDFSYLGSYGTRGVGYEVSFLVYQISRELGLTQDWAVAIIGIGNLGHALANYGGFASRGFRVAALFDADPALTGSVVAGVRVRHTDELESAIRGLGISIFVISTPAPAAQDVADRLVAAGITSILNFAPVVLNVPEGVDVRKVDLSIELQILAFHEQRKGGHALPQAGEEPAASDGGGKTAGGPAASAPPDRSALDPSLIDTGIPS